MEAVFATLEYSAYIASKIDIIVEVLVNPEGHPLLFGKGRCKIAHKDTSNLIILCIISPNNITYA